MAIFSSITDWFTGYDAAAADKAAAADAQLRAMAAADYGPGGKYYTPSNWAAVQADYATQAPFGQDTQRNAIDAQFTETLQTEADAIVGKPLGFLGSLSFASIMAVLKAIPWWVYALGFTGVFFYFGGGKYLLGKIKKA